MATYSPATLPLIDSVDIVSLRNVDANRVDEYMNNAAGAATVNVDGGQAQRIAALWRSLPPGSQSRCHTPPYGLRFRSGERVVCEASLCWECDNLFGEAEGQAIHYEFDAAHATSQALFAEIQRTANA